MTIRQDAFTKDLGDDFVALDSRGHGVARAASLEALKAAAPHASDYFDAKGLDKALADEKAGRRKPRDVPQGTDPTIAATAHANPDASFEQAVVNAERHSPEGMQKSREDTVAKAKEELDRQRNETGQPDSGKQNDPAHVDPTVAEQRKAGGAEAVNQTKSGQESKQPDPLDHDEDGRKGGSKPGNESTVAQGRARRQRKSAK